MVAINAKLSKLCGARIAVPRLNNREGCVKVLQATGMPSKSNLNPHVRKTLVRI